MFFSVFWITSQHLPSSSRDSKDICFFEFISTATYRSGIPTLREGQKAQLVLKLLDVAYHFNPKPRSLLFSSSSQSKFFTLCQNIALGNFGKTRIFKKLHKNCRSLVILRTLDIHTICSWQLQAYFLHEVDSVKVYSGKRKLGLKIKKVILPCKSLQSNYSQKLQSNVFIFQVQTQLSL